jgi:integrase
MEEYAGVSTLQDLDKEQFDKMATRFQEEHPLEPQGWGNVMKIFRPFFGWCKEKGKILVSPINEETWAPDLSNVESKAQVWEDEEYKAVLEVASDRDKIILQVLRGTGIYPMDFFQLEKSHFKMNKKIDVLVMTKKRAKSKAKRKAMSYVQPVTRKVRGIVEAAIDRMLEHNEKHPDDIQTRIFWDITGNVKPNTFSVGIAHRLNGYWKSLYPREEPKGCLDFRHTFATRNAENGIPFHQLRLWMAHEPNSPTLARIYLHLNITEKYLPMED